ncbi:MAG TPA: hypothetical protein VFG04_05600 [Planctomycetaceae bacterium]|nr:hypothetical protein [Planctomycetaceae bacterium]
MTEDELKKIAAPVEVPVGDRDSVKQLYVAPLRRSRPDWSVVEIARAGHVTCIMKPEFRDEIALGSVSRANPRSSRLIGGCTAAIRRRQSR